MILNIVFGFISILGVIATVYYGKKFYTLEKAKKTLTWHDLQVISDSISFSLKKDKFIPDLILCPGTRGGILAELLLNKFDRNIPVFVGISHRDFDKKKSLDLRNYQVFNISDDWDIFIPDSVFDFKEKNILIVDDFCLTGEFFLKLKRYLSDNGFHAERIRIFCSVITKVTKSAERAPDYYSLITDDDYFYFPWGKANMG